MRQQLQLGGGFDFFSNELGLRDTRGVFDQHGHLIGWQHRQIQLDEVRERQPGGVGRFKHRVAERKAKATRLQRLQDGQARLDLCGRRMPQRRDLKNHLPRVEQRQMPLDQAFVGAVHEDQAVAQQLVLTRMRQRGEGQHHVAGRRVRGMISRAIEEFMPDDLPLSVDDRLPGDQSAVRLALRRSGLWYRGCIHVEGSDASIVGEGGEARK
ncbi:hypothetical protein SDC9_135349 [bioreactor metagenome]|uniref:Uncharacterized protein n=1 Tax=bioreactor metagenome TaxID=1076179 RepID=A0A645DGT3_9ZZZZ